MAVETRTSKGIMNAKIALLFYILNLIIQFFSRKIFLDYLGSEVLGLNTTAQNLLGFLNIAELGIGSAVAYNLYKPLYLKDRNTINSIVSIQGWLYRRIAYIVILGAFIMMLFFPIIFEKTELPIWYTYGAFIAFLTSSLLGYFVNYKQIVLSADQKEYKITLSVQGTKLIKVILQIIAIIYLINGYLWWMLIEIFMAFVTSFVLNNMIVKEYPWLKTEISEGKKLQSKYPSIITKTKQIFFHKIGSFVLTQTSPIIIYAFTSLTLVAIYGNYMLIISGLNLLLNALFNGFTAGIGNLVAEGNKDKIKRVYWEITSFRIWISGFLCFGIYILSDFFIVLWIGNQYLLPNTTLSIIVINTFLGFTRNNDSFINAYGLYNDVWAPVFEAIINLSMSVLLGLYFGLSGILLGVSISLFIVIHCWKPYFLYKNGFKENIGEYVFKYIKYISFIVVSSVICIYLIDNLIRIRIETFLDLGIYALLVMVIYLLVSIPLLLSFDKSFKCIMKRIVLIRK